VTYGWVFGQHETPYLNVEQLLFRKVKDYLHIGEGLEARLMYKKNGKTGEDNWKDMMVHDEDAEMMMVMWK
jgi:hypothetical protein